ncbi:MAG: DNA replication and repair protein RecF [Gammaproteobacteria bacterium]
MAIKKLSLLNFRCFNSLEIDLTPGACLFWGNNGSGKSSIIEAIYILNTAKSFRTNILDSSIQRNKDFFSLKGITDNSKKIEITKQKNKPISIKINDKKTSSLDLLKTNSLLSIDHNTYFYNDSSPDNRRKHLDRALFSVFNEYSEDLLKFYFVLRARNLALKKSSPKETQAWNVSLGDLGERLTIQRKEFFDQSKENFLNTLARSSHPKATLYKEIEIFFDSGYKNLSYAEVLDKNLSEDLFKKITTAGPHRADIRFLFNGMHLKNSFSRGEQKIISILWSLSYAQSITQLTTAKPIISLDDLGSEVDSHHLEFLYPLFNNFENQLIFSNINSLFDSKIETPFNNFKMFHVEQLHLDA